MATDLVDIRLPVGASSKRAGMWRVVTAGWQGRLGAALGVMMVVLLVVGPEVAPYSPTQIGFIPNQGPSSSHWLGTDNLGRDVLSRFLYGGRSVLIVPMLSVALALLVGGALGLLGAYKRGPLDRAINWVFDLFLTLPSLLVVIVLIAGFGTSTVVMVLAVGLVYAPRSGKLIRGATLAVITDEYVSAAQARGERTPWILGGEVLPNIAGPTITEAALRLTFAIMFVSTLSYLGLGAQPPSSNWGLMIAQAQPYLQSQPWAALAPAAGLALLAIAVNLVADAMARYWEPGFAQERITV